jgi:hypothetical protein
VCTLARRWPGPAPELRRLSFANIPWFATYAVGNPTKPTTATAKHLARRSLTPAQFSHVITADGRSDVLAAAVEANVPGPQQLEELLTARGFTAELSEAILDKTPVSRSWLIRAADRVENNTRLELWLQHPDVITDADLAEALRDYRCWGPAHGGRGRVERLLARRGPALAGAVLSDDPDVRNAAARCRHLAGRVDWQRAVAEVDDPNFADVGTGEVGSWAAQRLHRWGLLMDNPVVQMDLVRTLGAIGRYSSWRHQSPFLRRLGTFPGTIETPFDAEPDPAVLSALLEQLLQMWRPGGADDLIAVLANPNLTRTHVHRIAWALDQPGQWAYDDELTAAAADLLDRFPDVAADRHLDPEQLRRPQQQAAAVRRTDTRRRREDGISRQRVDRAFIHSPAAAVAYLDTELADNATAWQFLFAALSGPPFEGSLADLAMVAITAS